MLTLARGVRFKSTEEMQAAVAGTCGGASDTYRGTLKWLALSKFETSCSRSMTT